MGNRQTLLCRVWTLAVVVKGTCLAVSPNDIGLGPVKVGA